MKKVLLLTSRADFGGGPEHIFQLLSHISQTYDCYVACPQDKPYYEKYITILSPGKVLHLPHRSFHIKSLLTLSKLIKSEGIQLLHSHGKGAGLYSRLLSLLTCVPCIHTFHGLHIGSYNHFQKIIYNLYEYYD